MNKSRGFTPLEADRILTVGVRQVLTLDCRQTSPPSVWRTSVVRQVRRVPELRGRVLRRMAKPRTAMVQGKPITGFTRHAYGGFIRHANGGFTLIELLVVIAIIALLMGILMPALQRVKKQSRTVACLTKLKQWAIYFSMYAEDYDGYYMEGFNGRGGADNDNRWVRAMGAYYKWDSDFTCCPEATQPWFTENGAPTGLRGTFRGSTSAWGYYGPGTGQERIGWLKPVKGSYGMNGWVNNPMPGHSHGGKPEAYHWRTPNVKGAALVPLFFGAQRYNVWPEHIDIPPDFDGQVWGDNHIGRVCLNRHKGFVNGIFLDFTARKVGLKELWTLKWHKNYNTSGPYTMAGGAQPSDWPQWLRPFKDY